MKYFYVKYTIAKLMLTPECHNPNGLACGHIAAIPPSEAENQP